MVQTDSACSKRAFGSRPLLLWIDVLLGIVVKEWLESVRREECFEFGRVLEAQISAEVVDGAKLLPNL